MTARPSDSSRRSIVRASASEADTNVSRAAVADQGGGSRPLSRRTILPGRPSPVLPFRPIGAAGLHAAIADALPHELIAELSRLRWLFVTARGSSFRLRGSHRRHRRDRPPARRTVLPVRHGGDYRARVSLSRSNSVDTRDGGVVWAEHFAGSIDYVHQIPRGDSLTDPRGPGNPDPPSRGCVGAPHGDRKSRRLVVLSPRPPAHVPIQPQR